jgi:hypothetical protein
MLNPRRRPLAAAMAALVAVLALAGCAGGTGGSDSEPTRTPRFATTRPPQVPKPIETITGQGKDIEWFGVKEARDERATMSITMGYAESKTGSRGLKAVITVKGPRKIRSFTPYINGRPATPLTGNATRLYGTGWTTPVAQPGQVRFSGLLTYADGTTTQVPVFTLDRRG